MTSIQRGGVSTRQQFLGINYASNTKGGVTLLNNKGVDKAGNKHLTASERFSMLKKGGANAQFRASDASNRNAAAQANTRAKQTYQNAAANGTITRFEQREINSANRDAGIANKQVQVDNARRHLGHVQTRAAADGKITPAEQQQINSARSNLGRLSNELNQMKATDRRMDRADSKVLNSPLAKFGNAIDNAMGRGRQVGGFQKPMRHCGCMGGARGQIGTRPPRIGRPRTQRFGGSQRAGRHVAVDNGRLKFTNKQGIDRSGTKHMYRGERLNMMRQGSQKAKFSGADAANRHAAWKANNNVATTMRNAQADGKITRFEQRDIAGAKRDANIANKQVEYDTARRQLGAMERNFAADGKLTKTERRQLTQARANLGKLGAELNKLKTHDAKMDKADAAYKSNPFNKFLNAIEGGSYRGATPQIGINQPPQQPYRPMPHVSICRPPQSSPFREGFNTMAGRPAAPPPPPPPPASSAFQEGFNTMAGTTAAPPPPPPPSDWLEGYNTMR
jgi:hypothetical protein